MRREAKLKGEERGRVHKKAMGTTSISGYTFYGNANMRKIFRDYDVKSDASPSIRRKNESGIFYIVNG